MDSIFKTAVQKVQERIQQGQLLHSKHVLINYNLNYPRFSGHPIRVVMLISAMIQTAKRLVYAAVWAA